MQGKHMIRMNENNISPTTRINETNVTLGIELRIDNIIVNTFNVVLMRKCLPGTSRTQSKLIIKIIETIISPTMRIKEANVMMRIRELIIDIIIINHFNMVLMRKCPPGTSQT